MNKQNRIVHLTSVHPVYDTRIFWKECVSLAETGSQVILVAPHDQSLATDYDIEIVGIQKAKSRFSRMLWTSFQVCQIALQLQGDIYHFHDPELIPVGLILKKIYSKKVIYDVHEDLPRQILSKFWIPKTIRHLVALLAEKIELVGAKEFDARKEN